MKAKVDLRRCGYEATTDPVLNQRLITATCLITLVLAALFLPWGLFPIFVAVLLATSAWEWSALAKLNEAPARIGYTLFIVVLFLVALFFQDEIVGFAFRISTLMFWFWILVIPLLVRFPDTKPVFQNTAVTATLGAVILLSTAMGLLWLKSQENGAWLVICLFSIVTIADSGAYFAGKRWGVHKLAPEISPGKSLEGVYGGLVANFVFSVFLVFGLNMSPEHSFLIVLIVLLTGLFSVEGDLLESAIKRSQGVKDSGTILPGHGGVLDRIDGVCAATPCFIFCVLFFFADTSL